MRFKFQLTFAVGCIGLLALSLPAFGRPSSRAPEAQRTDQIEQVLPKPRPERQRAPDVRRPHSYVERLVEASKPILGWPALVTEARKYLGTNPTDRKRLWCATFMNLILAKLGYPVTHSDAARSFAYYGRRIAKPQIGAIAVLTRGKRGGHVGVVSGLDPHGNPIIISGNHNRRVGEGIYPRSRVIAYVMPTRRALLARTAERARASVPMPDRQIDSPITELITAIEAEQAHAEARAPRRPQMRRAEAPRRVVQQMPD